MVDTLLIVISVASLIIWFVQEKFARPQLQEKLNQLISDGKTPLADQLMLDTMPSWNDLLVKAVFAMWLAWFGAVLMLKDGDFAFVLVMLTLFSGFLCGLDALLFSGARKLYIESKSVVDYLSKYAEDQRDGLTVYFGQDMVVGEYARSFFPVLAIVLVLRSFIVEPFQIPSASMVPTLQVGDYILVNKFHYGIRLPVLGTKIVEMDSPQRGDVMVFFPPHDKRYFIKRVIGLPGDQIAYKQKKLYINGEEIPQTFLAELFPDPGSNKIARLFEEELNGVSHSIYNTKNARHFGDFSTTVKPGHYFMMGDNRDNSSDSRVWGQVPEENIVGQAFAVWMHWGSFGTLPSFDRVGTIY